jgi:hypothetical protein
VAHTISRQYANASGIGTVEVVSSAWAGARLSDAIASVREQLRNEDAGVMGKAAHWR